MLRVGGPPLAPLRGRAAFIPAVGLPPVAGLADVEHRAAPHAAAPERAVPDGAGHRPGTGAACAWEGRCGTGCAWPSADGPRPGNGAPGRRVRPRAGEDLHSAPWGRARVPVPVVVCGSGAARGDGRRRGHRRVATARTGGQTTAGPAVGPAAPGRRRVIAERKQTSPPSRNTTPPDSPQVFAPPLTGPCRAIEERHARSAPPPSRLWRHAVVPRHRFLEQRRGVAPG